MSWSTLTPAGGSGGVDRVGLSGYLRRKTVDRPFGVANDFVASRLGLAIGAPIPPGELVLEGYNYGYVSLGFGEGGQSLPPADLEAFVKRYPWEATGVLVLDQWLGNHDRHDENLALHPTLGVAAFDHDLALVGAEKDNPVEALRKSLHQPVTGHPIAAEMESIEYFEEWIARVLSVRKEEIRRVVGACYRAKIFDEAVYQAAVDYVWNRRRDLRFLLGRTRSDFVKVGQWTLPEEGWEAP